MCLNATTVYPRVKEASAEREKKKKKGVAVNWMRRFLWLYLKIVEVSYVYSSV
jgi:hypothetical protein